MNVTPARKIFSRSTAEALEQLVDDHGFDQELKTTAFICRKIHRWYDIVNSRSQNNAFSSDKPEKYDEAMRDLDDFYHIMHTMTFRSKRVKDGQVSYIVEDRKPFKWGVLLTITSIKNLAKFFIKDIGQKSLLTKVFSTESVENLFSSVRARKKAPTALELRYIIRSLIIVKYMKPSKHGSYDDADEESDDKEKKKGFLAELKEIRKREKEEEQDNMVEFDYPILTGDYKTKDYQEEIALCNLIGCVLKRTICTVSHCETCIDYLVQDKPTLEVHSLITRKSWANGCKTYPTWAAYQFYSHCESVFHKNTMAVNRGGKELEKVFAHLYEVGLSEYGMPICHLELILHRFHKIRMYFEARQLNVLHKKTQQDLKTESKSKHASKSMAGHALK